MQEYLAIYNITVAYHRTHPRVTHTFQHTNRFPLPEPDDQEALRRARQGRDGICDQVQSASLAYTVTGVSLEDLLRVHHVDLTAPTEPERK